MISLLCPTRKRPERFTQMLVSVLETASLPDAWELIAYVADDDNSYDRLIAEKREWKAGIYPPVKYVRGPRLIMSDLWNACIPHARGDIFMLCADDVIFRTPGWDVAIEAAFAAVPDRILLAYADDCGPSGKVFATLPFVSREWVNVVGYFTGPGFSADFSDTWPNDVAKMIGRHKYVDVKIEHVHWLWGKAPKDQVYTENLARLAKDRCDVAYMNRIDERRRDAAKLQCAIQNFAAAKGVSA